MNEASNPYAALGYTDEEWLFKQSLREFCEKEMEPRWQEAYDPKTCAAYEREFYKRLASEFDVIRLIVPEEQGGLGQRLLTEYIVIEEVARVSAGVSIAVTMPPFFLKSMIPSCSAAFKKWGEGIMNGDIWLASSMCSPEGQANFAEMAEIVSFDEKTQEWVLNGGKAYSSGGCHCDILKVVGLMGDNTYDLYMPIDTPGLSFVENPELGCGTEAPTFSFKNVRIPKEYGVKSPIYVNGELMTCGKPNPFTLGVGWLALGGMEAAFEKTLDYLNNRMNNFEPITALGAIQYKFAQMKTKIETVRSLLVASTNFIEVGNNPKLAGIYSHAAKAFACDTARDITSECIQMWGCAGYNTESGMMRYNLDAQGYSIGTCTSEMHMAQIAYELDLPNTRPGTL